MDVPRNILKYIVAHRRIVEVAISEGWGAGSPPSYQMELQQDFHQYAIKRCGATDEELLRHLRGGHPLISRRYRTISDERDKRIIARKRNIPSEAQKKCSYRGLMRLETKRTNVFLNR